MSQAAVLGVFSGALLAVAALTFILGRFIRRPILPAFLATLAASLLSIGGNDGVNLLYIMSYALAGALCATWRAWRELRRLGARPE